MSITSLQGRRIWQSFLDKLFSKRTPMSSRRLAREFRPSSEELEQRLCPTGNLLTNPGAETGSLAGWTVGGPSTAFVDNGAFDPGINPHSGAYDFVGGSGTTSGSSGTLTQNVGLNHRARLRSCIYGSRS